MVRSWCVFLAILSITLPAWAQATRLSYLAAVVYAAPVVNPAFRNATTPPPPGWTGPVFQLSHNYPTKDPGVCPKDVCTWLDLDMSFNQPIGEAALQWGGQWAEYIKRILDYVKKGQDLELDNKKGWNISPNGTLTWFHVPWMAYDPTRGREFVHGLTNERTATIADFEQSRTLLAQRARGPKRLPHILGRGRSRLPLSKGSETSQLFETWAFGVYNPWGAYAIGRSINTKGVPVIGHYGGVSTPAGLPFPEGTVVAKLLFTTATPEDVPYLATSPTWQADRHVQKGEEFLCQRKVQPVRLVQLDVAVVDARSPTRWVFGTFAFNGKLSGPTAWDKLEPVGLQWGNDPWTFPGVPKDETNPPSESVLNTKIGTPQHFGCNGRLAGPVDNRLSSCLSCHAAGFAPPAGIAATPTTTPPIFGYPGECTNYSADNVQYFNNIQFPMAYTGGQFPNLLNMDTSLQLQIAFEQYGQFREYHQPVQCVDSP